MLLMILGGVLIGVASALDLVFRTRMTETGDK